MVLLVASVMAAGAAPGAPKTTTTGVQAEGVSSPAAADGLAPKTRKPRTLKADKAFPTTVYSPAQAIAEAAKAEGAAKGVFEFKVASVGGNDGKGRSIFLNSEADHHDAKNISAMVRPVAVQELEQTLGAPLDKALAGKRIAVTGTAHPKTINIYDEAHNKTGQTFTRTRVMLAKAEKLAVK
jgi:hypothetical protein